MGRHLIRANLKNKILRVIVKVEVAVGNPLLLKKILLHQARHPQDRKSQRINSKV